MNDAKKLRKTIEWERLEISSQNIRDTKGTFHAKMGSIKDRNGKDLTEAEEEKGARIYRRTTQKRVLRIQITTAV